MVVLPSWEENEREAEAKGGGTPVPAVVEERGEEGEEEAKAVGMGRRCSGGGRRSGAFSSFLSWQDGSGVSSSSSSFVADLQGRWCPSWATMEGGGATSASSSFLSVSISTIVDLLPLSSPFSSTSSCTD